jgi:hypothetical protein
MTISQVHPWDLVASLVCLTMAGSPVSGCTATGLRTVTPSNAPPDISYRMARDSPSHRGITIGGSGFQGYEIIAGADGLVVWVRHDERRDGNQVRIRHDLDSNQQPIYTDHYHIHGQLVKAGDEVRRGQTIGFMGAHYHFIVLKEEGPEKFVASDPKDYWFGIDLYKEELRKGLGTGSFVIPCFDPNVSYQKEPIRFTYPAKCK